jgi:predicted AAA+ superfamily ATPase
MLPRTLQAHLTTLLAEFPVVALLGPRQVGKTTLAETVAQSLGERALYLDLELPSDRAKVSDAELYFADHADRLIILDEIHRLPDLFTTLRGVVDRRRRAGGRVRQFLLLGSASIELMRQSAETLAGRVAYAYLTPFSVREVAGTAETAHEGLWVRGGFPDSFLAKTDAQSYRWRTAFIRTYLERDVPALGPRIPAETLGRFWQMLAHNQGQLLNAAQLAGSLGISGHTVARYLDIMVELLLVRRLLPWATSAKKRLVRSPKVYVRDSGLVHGLLEIRDREQLLGHPVAGASWEGMLVENVIGALPENGRASFYRTAAGAEIDLVVEFGRERWAIEMKRSLSDPSPKRGFHIACADIEATRQVVLYPGRDRFSLDEKTEVMPLETLLQSLPGSR